MRVTSLLKTVAIAAAIVGAPLASQAAVVTQLGFLVDASGSIGNGNFSIMRGGYAAAFAALPTDGSIEVTVISFASATASVVAPTIVTAATLPGILTSVNGMVYTGGSTNTALGINAITAAMVGSANYSSGLASMINLATDGEPNSQADAIAAAVNARTRGIDAMTAEAIGGNNATAGNIADMVFSPLRGPCNDCGTLLADGVVPPNPMTNNPWVLRVTDFGDFPVAINAKIQASIAPTTPTPPAPPPAPGPIGVPEPSGLALVGLALAGLAWSRRKAV